MHQKFATALATVSMLISSAAHSASDPGLTVPGALYQKAQSGGVGAQMGVRIKLGQDHVVRDVDRVEFGIAAGPVVSVRDARTLTGFRQGIAPLARFSLKPGYGSNTALMGQSLIETRTAYGLAEDERAAQRIDPKQKQGISTLGVVGIVAGVAVVGYIGLHLYICRDGCSD
jgi:hypothetical protein